MIDVALYIDINKIYFPDVVYAKLRGLDELIARRLTYITEEQTHENYKELDETVEELSEQFSIALGGIEMHFTALLEGE
jgi:hypothetical protein